MDLLRQARGMLLAIQTGRDVVQYLHPELRFHGPRGDMGRGELLDRLERQPGKLFPGEVMMRRNLVLASWERLEEDEVVGSGTWILSFDREGKVIEWTEVAA